MAESIKSFIRLTLDANNMSTYNYGTYDAISKAHRVAVELGWIARIGYDQKRGLYWVEYVWRSK